MEYGGTIGCLDYGYGLRFTHYGLRMEVYVFRLYFGLWATDIKCYNFICFLILVSTDHDFKLHVQDFGLNKKHAVMYL